MRVGRLQRDFRSSDYLDLIGRARMILHRANAFDSLVPEHDDRSLIRQTGKRNQVYNSRQDPIRTFIGHFVTLL